MRFDPALPEEGINVSPTHPLRELVVLVAGLVGCVVALVTVAAVAVDQLVPLLPPGLEARLFSFVPAAAGEAEAEEETDAREQALQALLERLLRHWPESPYEFRIAILEESEPNAIAFPGGFIAVTTGLLDQAESENEIAMVLGHELGHFRNRDHLRGLGRGLALSLALAALGAGGSDALVGMAGLASDLTQRGFDRDQESEADAFGLGLVQAEYGHVAGAADFFRRLPDPEGIVEEKLATYLSTHPLGEERVEALERIARERGWSRDGELLRFAIVSQGTTGSPGVARTQSSVVE